LGELADEERAGGRGEGGRRTGEDLLADGPNALEQYRQRHP